MTRPLARSALRLIPLLLTFLLAIGIFTGMKNLGWLSPLGIDGESRDSQVIQAIERTQEVSLLSLGIQGIKDKNQFTEVFGQRIPGTTETVFLQYNFNAKLGIDGSRVTVTRTGENGYRISVPEFTFIGYEEPTFRVAVEDGSVLSWVTEDIDTVDMVNEILNDTEQEEYLASYDQPLREQTEAFYDRLITSIDASAVTTFEFDS